ncbi:MAG TPA: patatin-like phospholipase family protein [Enhygromyxa sp.]|nr:patatin-like phospholipase family protein [Enhygromyxa sp.]
MVELRARAWVLDDNPEFPEAELPSLRRRANVGLCLSGGGTRSFCASIGYLRALHALGLLDRVRYIAGVSGGSWATVPYSFWQRGPVDDAALLGPIVGPKHLREDMLERELETTELAACATGDFRKALFDELLDEGPGAAWVGAVGEIFLAPFGLYDRTRARSYSLDQESRSAILARQPAGAGLSADDFTLLRPNRPFPVIQSTLMGPPAGGDLRRFDAISLQFTPLYVGCPANYQVELDYHRDIRLQRNIGGGLVEPFAFGGPGPLAVGGAVDDFPTAGIEPTGALAFMAGTSSTAYAAAIQKVPEFQHSSRRVPCARCWPWRTDSGLESELWEIGDGGLIENYGLLPLLQRGIDTAIVCINTVTPLDLEYVPGQGSSKDRVDTYLPPLFGIGVEQDGLVLGRNQVFPTEEFAELVAALQAAKRAGDPLVVVREHQLLDNAWWRIRGGRKLRVAWVYLDRAARFEAELPDDTARAIRAGHRWPRIGPCQRFPNYDTIDQNFLELVQLTPYQIRLLTQFCSWVVLERRDVLGELMG